MCHGGRARRQPSKQPTENSGNRKRWRQTGWGQSTPPLSTIRTRHGNSVSTPESTRTCKTRQNSFQKGKPIRNFSIDPTSSIRTRLRAPFLRSRNANQHYGLNGPFPLLNGPFSDLNSQSPDLPLPHGLALSETALSTESPRNKGVSGPGAPIF